MSMLEHKSCKKNFAALVLSISLALCPLLILREDFPMRRKKKERMGWGRGAIASQSISAEDQKYSQKELNLCTPLYRELFLDSP